jgi:transcription elongation factor GreA
MNDHIITQEGFDKLKKELEFISTVRRREIADRIEKAKELGDLSENAEYHEAKEAHAFNEGRIAEIKNLLKNLTVVHNGNTTDSISMGSCATVRTGDKEKKYCIVSFNEADPQEGKISNESPMGRELIGKKKGDKVIVSTPKGETEYEIIKIE